jgi:hypothetical protein
MNTIFNFNRIKLLIQRYFSERIQGELIFLSIMTFVFMFFRNSPITIGITIVIAGMFHAGKFFREIHSPANGINYFLIPATQLEKISVSFLFTVVYFFAKMLLAYIIGNLAGTGLNNLLANMDFLSSSLPLFQTAPLKWELFESIENGTILVNGKLTTTASGSISYAFLFFKLFLLTQSLFVLGGIYFKRNQTLKTLLALIIITFAFSFTGGIELNLLTGESRINIVAHMDSLMSWGHTIGNVLRISYWWLIPYLWIISYFRLTEIEI